jgi:protein-disulfide isomerase-like protein with CxxC motif
MTPELYFIYDSHCPWSYATTVLVNSLAEACPEIDIHFWHCANYDGNDCAGKNTVDEVLKKSSVKFGKEHIRFVDSPKNSMMTANLMTWLENKQPEKVLPVLNAIQNAHFIDGNPLGCKHDFMTIIDELKLSPPNKVFKDELTQESEFVLSDIAELQEFMGTNAFPALLLTHDDKAVLLDHSIALNNPQAFVRSVKKQLV